MSEGVNENLTKAQQAFKTLIWEPTIIALRTEAPWMSIPVLKQIIDIGLSVAWKFLVMFIDIGAIKLLNSAHQSAYERESIKLAVLERDFGLDSKEYKDAKEVAKLAMSKFTRINQ